jgi:hypothetical protein
MQYMEGPYIKLKKVLNESLHTLLIQEVETLQSPNFF